ncbi:MAG: GNAT family N-acetyltransferase [Bacteroidota bacterium]
MSTLLHPVAPAYWQTLQAIGREAYSLNFADHWEGDGLAHYLEQEFGQPRLQTDLQDPNVGYFFIGSVEKPVGFLKVKWDAPLSKLKNTPVAELEKLYLLPSEKGKGLGKQAIHDLTDILRSKGTEFLFLCVIDTNQAAIQFYERLRFAYYDRTRLNIPLFKKKLRGMHRMILPL